MNKDEISKLVQDDIFQQKIDISEFPEIDSSHYICKDSYKIQLSKDISYMPIND